MLLSEARSKIFDLIPSALQPSPVFANPTVINAIGDFTPVVGTTFGFVKTAKRVYNCTSPLKAVKVGVKSVVIDCTPPVIKYPVLCSALFVCAASTFYTGNPNLACGAIKCAEIIIEEATGG